MIPEVVEELEEQEKLNPEIQIKEARNRFDYELERLKITKSSIARIFEVNAGFISLVSAFLLIIAYSNNSGKMLSNDPISIFNISLPPHGLTILGIISLLLSLICTIGIFSYGFLAKTPIEPEMIQEGLDNLTLEEVQENYAAAIQLNNTIRNRIKNILLVPTTLTCAAIPLITIGISSEFINKKLVIRKSGNIVINVSSVYELMVIFLVIVAASFVFVTVFNILFYTLITVGMDLSSENQ